MSSNNTALRLAIEKSSNVGLEDQFKSGDSNHDMEGDKMAATNFMKSTGVLDAYEDIL